LCLRLLTALNRIALVARLKPGAQEQANGLLAQGRRSTRQNVASHGVTEAELGPQTFGKGAAAASSDGLGVSLTGCSPAQPARRCGPPAAPRRRSSPATTSTHSQNSP